MREMQYEEMCFCVIIIQAEMTEWVYFRQNETTNWTNNYCLKRLMYGISFLSRTNSIVASKRASKNQPNQTKPNRNIIIIGYWICRCMTCKPNGIELLYMEHKQVYTKHTNVVVWYETKRLHNSKIDMMQTHSYSNIFMAYTKDNNYYMCIDILYTQKYYNIFSLKSRTICHLQWAIFVFYLVIFLQSNLMEATERFAQRIFFFFDI